MKKILITILIILTIFLISVSLIIKYGLVDDRRAEIAKELFLNENNQFDYNLLEQRLNERYRPIDMRQDLKSFILEHGGECNVLTCTLSIYSTICLSKVAKIELKSEPNIIVTSYVEDC